MTFHKYHALGNDYIVIDPKDAEIDLTAEKIKLICHRNYGIGSDGILYGPVIGKDFFELKIFNPDGSEAKKSGNGLRIFSRCLWDKGLMKENEFILKTKGGKVSVKVIDHGRSVRIEMGKLSFDAGKIPVNNVTGEVINKKLIVKGKIFNYSAATIGNPHCIIILDEVLPEIAKKYGPLVENYSGFPNRTNVQFVKVIDRNNIQIEIWERGAGYTLASGSSSIAAAGTAYKRGLCNNKIAVRMQGGELNIEFDNDFNAIMTGPVSAVYSGEFKKEFFDELK